MFEISILLRENTINIYDVYDSKIVPNVGDVILLTDNKMFKVVSRVLSAKNAEGIALYGDIVG